MSTRTIARKSSRPSAHTMGLARRAVTIGLGCGIPAFCLYTSHRGGQLLSNGAWACGGMLLAICITMLALSLSHLAEAVRDVAKLSPRNSWLMAAALDCGIVACELTQAAGHDGGWLATAFLIGITGASMLLNSWAMLGHKRPTSAARKGR